MAQITPKTYWSLAWRAARTGYGMNWVETNIPNYLLLALKIRKDQQLEKDRTWLRDNPNWGKK